MSLRHVFPVLGSACFCVVVAALLVIGTVGCERDDTSKAEAPKTGASKTETPTAETTVTTTSPPAAPVSQAPGSKLPTRPATVPSRIAAAHILVSFADARNPPLGVSRTKEEAKARAEQAKEMARKPETVWEDAVKTFSDDVESVAVGGKIGILEDRQRQLVHAYGNMANAVFGMEIGQVSEVVESPQGYHVLTRLEIVEYSASHILVQYKGSQAAKPTVTRTKAEARARAEEALAKARAENADFAALAKEYSDGPSAEVGGNVPTFPAGAKVPGLEFEQAVAKIKIGDVTGPVETKWGFHVIRRNKIDRVGASHILIAYKGGQRAKPSVTRTKEEALKLAEQAYAEVKAPGANFAQLAKKYSDGPNAQDGAVIGLIERGNLGGTLEETAFGLEVNGIAGPIETPFGYHIVLRTE